jgi:hypothetical protein
VCQAGVVDVGDGEPVVYYRESSRYCRTCERKTRHFWGATSSRRFEGLNPLNAFLWMRDMYCLFIGDGWRCADCDHPWQSSLLDPSQEAMNEEGEYRYRRRVRPRRFWE